MVGIFRGQGSACFFAGSESCFSNSAMRCSMCLRSAAVFVHFHRREHGLRVIRQVAGGFIHFILGQMRRADGDGSWHSIETLNDSAAIGEAGFMN